MQTYTNLQETILQLFVEIDLHPSKPLRTMRASLIVCLLGNNKAHISRLGECLEINSAANAMAACSVFAGFCQTWDIADNNSYAADTSHASASVKSS